MVLHSKRASIPVRSVVALGCLTFSACNCDDELGVLNASVTVEPTMIDFGKVPVNSQKTLPLTIKNRGSFIATVSDFTADAPFIAPTISSTVSTFDEIQVDVVMRPTALGEMMGTLAFTTNDPDAPTITVPLVGEGIEAAVRVEPPIVDFGELLWNSQTVPPTVNVTVSNPGTDSFDLSNFTLADDGSGAFVVDDMGIEQTFGPGASATFSVTWNPNAMGAVSGLIRFDTTTAAAPQVEVPIMGTAVGPELEVCAGATGGPELCTAAGEVPAVQMLNIDRMGMGSGGIRVINAGNRDLVVQGQFALPEDEFAYNPDPSMVGMFTLTPNEERSFGVTYTPADYMIDVQTVIFASNSATRPTASVLVRGEVGRPQIRVDPAGLTFRQDGPASPARVTVHIGNCGTLPLTLNAAPTVVGGGGAFSVENVPMNGVEIPMEDCNMQPARNLGFDVVFDPPGDGAYKGTIEIQTNDPVTPVFEVSISGARV